MRRLIAEKVYFGLVTDWRLATTPTSLSPPSRIATTEGVVRAPSEFSITLAFPPSMTATQELVVPRSMPMILAILQTSFLRRPPHPCFGPDLQHPAWTTPKSNSLTRRKNLQVLATGAHMGCGRSGSIGRLTHPCCQQRSAGPRGCVMHLHPSDGVRVQ